MQLIYSSKGLTEENIKVYITSRQFGNMRIVDLSPQQLEEQITKMRILTGFTSGDIISPVPALTGRIWNGHVANGIKFHPGFYRTFKKYDGAVISSNGPSAYLLANADCPIGIITGRKSGYTVAVCMHLALECLRKGIIENGYRIAQQEMDTITGFFFGYGIGPDAYKFSVNHPQYGEKNRELLKWMEFLLAKEIPVSTEGDFPVDLHSITIAKLRDLGYHGPFVAEKKYPCTASAIDKKGEYIFSSNTRDRGKQEAMYRNAVLVSIKNEVL